MSANQHERLVSETAEERTARLQQMSANQRERLVSKTAEQREARLQSLRDRLASETAEERTTRLQQMSANQHERLTSEIAEERTARLQQTNTHQRDSSRLVNETAERLACSIIVTGTGSYRWCSHICHCLSSALFEQRC